MDGDAILDAIRASWPTLEERFDAEQRLIDTGADSLRVMQFVLRLEDALGRKVAYDLLSPEITPRALAASLEQDRVLPGDRPLVFFLSGLGGDNYVMLSHLRASLADEIAFAHVDPPGLGESPALLCNMGSTGAWIAARISAMQPDGELRLAGYSMGGFQAFEAARHLVASGRKVAFLCLFDPIPGRTIWRIVRDAVRGPSQLSPEPPKRRSRFERAYGLSFYQRRMVDLSLWFGAYRLAGRVARAGASADVGAQISVLLRMRTRAARRWRPKPLDIEALLVLTEDGARFGAERLWRKWIHRLSVVAVPGSHEALAHAPMPDCVRSALLLHVPSAAQ